MAHMPQERCPGLDLLFCMCIVLSAVLYENNELWVCGVTVRGWSAWWPEPQTWPTWLSSLGGLCSALAHSSAAVALLAGLPALLVGTAPHLRARRLVRPGTVVLCFMLVGAVLAWEFVVWRGCIQPWYADSAREQVVTGVVCSLVPLVFVGLMVASRFAVKRAAWAAGAGAAVSLSTVIGFPVLHLSWCTDEPVKRLLLYGCALVALGRGVILGCSRVPRPTEHESPGVR